MYHGNKKLNYTKIFADTAKYRWWDTEPDTETHNKGPEEIIQAITEYLKENLPPIIKNGIAFNTNIKTSTFNQPKITLRTNHTSFTVYGEIEFTDAQIKISRTSLFTREVTRTISIIDYADPQLFEKLELALRKFYNQTQNLQE